MRQPAFSESNLEEFIVLWRDVDRGHDRIGIAGYGKQESRATMITTDLQYLSSRSRPHQSKQEGRFIKLQQQQPFVGWVRSQEPIEVFKVALRTVRKTCERKIVLLPQRIEGQFRMASDEKYQ